MFTHCARPRGHQTEAEGTRLTLLAFEEAFGRLMSHVLVLQLEAPLGQVSGRVAALNKRVLDWKNPKELTLLHVTTATSFCSIRLHA